MDCAGRRPPAQAEVVAVRGYDADRPGGAHSAARRDDLRRHSRRGRAGRGKTGIRHIPATRLRGDDVMGEQSALWIDPGRLEAYITELAECGAYGETGVARLVYSPEWVAAQERVADW